MSPTQLTIRKLKALGVRHAEIVERWNPHARIRQDLFGFGDVLAIGDAVGTLLVQCTTRENANKRVVKITRVTADDKYSADRVDAAKTWLRCHNGLEVWGWSKDKAGRWQVERREITLADFEFPNA